MFKTLQYGVSPSIFCKKATFIEPINIAAIGIVKSTVCYPPTVERCQYPCPFAVYNFVLLLFQPFKFIHTAILAIRGMFVKGVMYIIPKEFVFVVGVHYFLSRWPGLIPASKSRFVVVHPFHNPMGQRCTGLGVSFNAAARFIAIINLTTTFCQ